MTDHLPLSPLRRTLCSQTHALRVAAWLRHDGIDAEVVATGDPLQPWRIVEAGTLLDEDHRVPTIPT